MSRSTKRFVFWGIYLFCSYIRLCFQLDAFVREHIWHKDLLMGYLMRLELTHVCSLNGFQLVMGFYETLSSLFLCVYLSLLYPSFTFDVWYVVCVSWNGFGFHLHLFSLCARVNVYPVVCVYVYMYVCFFPFVCVCRIHVLFKFSLNLSINFFSFIWSCV